MRAWSYAEREDDLLVKRGVLFSRLSVVPYGRMQFIDVTAGPIERSDVTISTTKLARVLSYEPKDLTISVEAGLPWAELTRLLAENR